MPHSHLLDAQSLSSTSSRGLAKQTFRNNAGASHLTVTSTTPRPVAQGDRQLPFLDFIEFLFEPRASLPS